MPQKDRRHDLLNSRPSALKTPSSPVAASRRHPLAGLWRLSPAARLFVVFVLYLALRGWFLGTMAPVHFSDTASYVDQYRGGFAGGFFVRVRSWGYPFFIWLCGHRLGLVVAAQRLVGALAWFALAWAAAGLFRSGFARRVALWGTLLFSLTMYSLLWDAMLLTESLSNSLFIALAAALAWLLGSRGAGLRPLGVLAALAVPFAGLRDANSLLLIFVALCAALALTLRFFRRPAARPRRLVFWTAWGLIAVLFAVGLGHLFEMRRCHRNWQSVGAVFSMCVFVKITGKQAHIYKDHIDWVARNYGLPVEDAISRLAKTAYAKPPISSMYENWLKQTGPAALIGFLSHHPGWVFETYNSSFQYGDTEAGLFYLQPLEPWQRAHIKVPFQIQVAIHKTLDPVLAIPRGNGLLALAAAALGVAWLVRAWRRGTGGALGVLFLLTSISAFMLFVTIFGDYNEPFRHAITGLLALYAAIPILVAAVIDRLAAPASGEQARGYTSLRNCGPPFSVPEGRSLSAPPFKAGKANKKATQVP